MYGYENHCTVLLNSAGEILDFSCECPYCEQQELACGHIGVVLLIVYDLKPESFPFTYSPLNQRGCLSPLSGAADAGALAFLYRPLRPKGSGEISGEHSS
mgnify:CR=1 FL=1